MGVRPGGVIALPVLALLVLGACGGSSDPLTTQEYADAMVETTAELQTVADTLQQEWTEDLADLIEAGLDAEDLLESAEWSDDDRERAGKLAERLAEAMSALIDSSSSLLRDYTERISRLSPPNHLTGLHGTMVEALERVLALNDEMKRDIEDLRAKIDSPQELETLMRRLDFGALAGESPEADSFNNACEALKEQLEAELGETVEIC